jgi:hypothetical protein
MADRSQQSQPLLASGWQRGCGQMIMMLGIALTAFSGLCTVGMTIADLTDSGHHGGDIDLSGIQYIIGAPFIVVGALIWWAAGPCGERTREPLCRPIWGERNDDSSDPRRDA